MTTMDQEDVTREKKMPSSGGRSAPVLPWMRDAIAVQEDALCSVTQLRGLDPRLRAHLMEQQIGDIFSIQLAVWEMCCGGKSSLHDICFSAPTGSGKTLAYGLPIVNALAEQNHSRHRLNCIMVLPTRGLAVQVHSVIAPLCESVGLECRLACGCQNIRSEAMELMSFDSYDIAIFTPGRLVAHIECTKGFSTACSGVRYFVADEADRLLRQTYNDWITKLFRAFYAGNNSDFDEKRPQISRKPLKFVVSATLTRDPSKLESLELSSPRFITFVQGTSLYERRCCSKYLNAEFNVICRGK
jgi:ATP-dependent RNA helicase DDX51/DBP6